MRRLGDEARARAADPGPAVLAARSVPSSVLTLEERISAAQLGVCLAARDWTPARGTWESYATRRAIWAIRDEVRAEKRWRRLEAGGPEPSREGDQRAVDLGDEAAPVLAALAALPATQRRAVEHRLAGLSFREIAAIEGWSLDMAKLHHIRAVRRLRERLAPPTPA